MAHARREDADFDLSGARYVEIDVLDGQGFAGAVQDGSFHRVFLVGRSGSGDADVAAGDRAGGVQPQQLQTA